MKKSQILLLVALGVLLLMSLAGVIFVRQAMMQEISNIGNKTMQVEKPLAHFSRIAVSGGLDIEIIPDTACSLTMKADSVLLKYIDIRVMDNELQITKRRGFWRNNASIWIYCDSLESVSVEAGAELQTRKPLTASHFSLEVNAGSTASVEGSFGEFTLSANAGSTVNINGSANQAVMDANAGSTVDASKLKTNDCSVSVSAGTTATVFAVSSLRADATAGSTIRYLGTPRITGSSTSAGGSIVKIDE